MVAPIPKSLLIHNVLYTPPSDGSWGNDTGEPTPLENVRIEPKSDITQSGNGIVRTNSTVLFVDTVNSTPVTLKEDGVITFDGYDYKIDKINAFYDEAKLHHWEVTLT